MKEIGSWCIKRVGGKERCNKCHNLLIKHGKSAANKVRYKCKSCNTTRSLGYNKTLS